jgi:hypothetical protein
MPQEEGTEGRTFSLSSVLGARRGCALEARGFCRAKKVAADSAKPSAKSPRQSLAGSGARSRQIAVQQQLLARVQAGMKHKTSVLLRASIASPIISSRFPPRGLRTPPAMAANVPDRL